MFVGTCTGWCNSQVDSSKMSRNFKQVLKHVEIAGDWCSSTCVSPCGALSWWRCWNLFPSKKTPPFRSKHSSIENDFYLDLLEIAMYWWLYWWHTKPTYRIALLDAGWGCQFRMILHHKIRLKKHVHQMQHVLMYHFWANHIHLPFGYLPLPAGPLRAPWSSDLYIKCCSCTNLTTTVEQPAFFWRNMWKKRHVAFWFM